MKQLTEYQKKFLLKFFYSEKHPGWQSIAESLLEKGFCVVAGEDCIWKGGVGNFIKLEKAEEFVSCSKYILDRESFVSSAWVREAWVDEVADKIQDLIDAEKKIEELKKEINEIKSLL